MNELTNFSETNPLGVKKDITPSLTYQVIENIRGVTNIVTGENNASIIRPTKMIGQIDATLAALAVPTLNAIPTGGLPSQMYLDTLDSRIYFNVDGTWKYAYLGENGLQGTITNADISSTAAIAISKTTLGTYISWATFVPSPTGYTGTPTVALARWSQIGKVVFIEISVTGTSNSTTVTFTLPVAANVAFDGPMTNTVNNGTGVSGGGLVEGIASSTTVNVYKDTIGNAWTNSGTKAWKGTFFYESI